MRHRVFIDTDTASDDAVALMMAFAHWGDDVVAIGVVAGNCSLEQATINALYTRELCGSAVPVYAGAGKPLIRKLRTAQHAHGHDGMSDIGLVPTSLAESVPKPAAGYAPDILIDMADRYPGDLTLVTLGPLTNIALGLAKRPDIAGKIRHCYMMGGASDNYGNITPVSEYNVWADPEAAEVAFASALRITMIGWDISRKYGVVTNELAIRLRALGTRKAEIAVDSQRALVDYCRSVTGVDGFDLPDPIAMAIAIDPSLATKTIQASVHVCLHDGLTRGQTIIDARSMTDRARTVTVVCEVSAAGFQERLFSCLRQG